jgi:hypothetical protein
MSNGRQLSGLDTLVSRILNAESIRDVDRDEIAFSVFHDIFDSDYREAMNLIGLERGVLSFLARSNDWKKALRHLLCDRRLVTALANELAGHSDYGYCSRGAELPHAFEKLLDTVELPIIRPPQRFRGRAQQEEFLSRTRRELDDLSDHDYDRFKDLADRGWGELETLTKIIVRFHGALFGKSDEIGAAFSKASRASGLNKRFDQMRNIQKKFQELTEDRREYAFNDERILCQWHFGRSSPLGDFLEGEVEVDLSQVPSSKWRESLTKFDNSKSDARGIVSVSVLNYYKTNVDFYRHFYAHSNRQEWVSAGSEMVQRSFSAAAKIIQEILDLNLCPDMIVPIAIGQDGFRRRVAFFVHEKHLQGDGSYSRRDIRAMFLGGDQFIRPHRFYFCPYPAESGIFEPFLVLADEII